MTIFVALNGPNDDGKKPKAPAQRGWESPGHKGINPKTYKGWYGLRCDGLIVIDCDSEEALDAWLAICGADSCHQTGTWVRKTPRGYHLVYRWHDPLGECDDLKGPHAGVLPGIDVRQGSSSQIVYAAPGLTPGYSTFSGHPAGLVDWHAPWGETFKLGKQTVASADLWDEMPEGVGNNTMAAIAGTMRKQGMSPYTMVRCLSAINRITMTSDPMPKDMILAIAKSVSRYDVDPMIAEIEYDEDASGTPLTDPGEIIALAEYIEGLSPEGVVGWDTESGASEYMRGIFPKAELHPYVSAYMTGISLATVEGPGEAPGSLEGVYVPVGHPWGNAPEKAVRRLLLALSRTAATQVTHHCLHDWPILALHARRGYRPPDGRRGRRGPHIDTQVLSWHQDENRPKGLKVLDEMYLGGDAQEEADALKEIRAAPYRLVGEARAAVRAAYPEMRQLGKSGKPIQALNEVGDMLARQLVKSRSWGQITADEMTTYAERDATSTVELAEHLLQAHPVQGALSRGQRREMDYQGVIYRMTEKGVSCDLDKLRAAAGDYLVRGEILRQGLEDQFGIENPASPDQCRKLLYGQLGLPVMGYTKSKKKRTPSTDKNALEMLQGDPVASRILECRKWLHAAGMATTLANHAEHSIDGRIHGHYSSTQTVTGRLSASGPNVMNIPRDDSLPEIRRAFFAPPPGFIRLGFDLSSAELWVTASVTQDPLLTSTLKEGRNLHVETMLAVFGGEPDKSRREYTLSKNVNFGIEYGAGLDQITIFAAKAGFGPREARSVAQKMRDGHKEAYKIQHRMAKYLADYAEKHGVIPMIGKNDRYRHFNTPGKMVFSYTALNALVQGGVAEFMKDTMLELDRTWLGKYLILQVHDELAFDVPDVPGIEQRAHRLLQRIARDINPFRYPLSWAAKQWKEDDEQP